MLSAQITRFLWLLRPQSGGEGIKRRKRARKALGAEFRRPIRAKKTFAGRDKGRLFV